MNLPQFGAYAKYYDLLYKDKNYRDEVDYVDSLIKKYSSIKVNRILDIGCGSGNHDILLSQKGYYLTGIDISQDMINVAKKLKINSNVDYYCCDSANFKLNKKFDCVISLFHVISYQTTNDNLFKTFKNAYDHLEGEGIFIFDFWYGPGVLTDRPAVRTKKMSDNESNIIRIATPDLFPNENVVAVNYEVIVEDTKSKTIEKIYETHKMRYFFIPELEFALKQAGFDEITALEWLSTDKKPDFNSWYALIVCRK
ncbi:MAG TPA: class I SAM-dependent methyltransferase [Spirochaetota bacterium]|jgi:SAM-dependent methyltransferase|nr:MAG: dTDP-3-amino-3,4,6-trideoxy-alpha-D-glucopyranose [Spirochaetes bacterium ADurb.Bin133]HNZ26108.1 class I SAM-dependent methyltransferase [Spirochaetota bacterium]HPY86575.1 class I SAM-dependent methyltransferase [Spirochaetota bacterium]HQB61699.1 class I SAM-dependent methyltransferase [Spirochaetota bacterium]